MMLLHIAGSVNNDPALVKEDAVEIAYTVSSGPQKFTCLIMDSSTTLNVTESLEEVQQLLQVGAK